MTTSAAETRAGRFLFGPKWYERQLSPQEARQLVSVAQFFDLIEEAEQRGYDRGRRDFQFTPEGDNHHNASLCPYCSPKGSSS